MPIIPYLSKSPSIAPDTFIAPDAWIIGDVTIAPLVTVLFGVVLRGDIESISIGAGTNIQEHSQLHTTHGLDPVRVGAGVTVGHRAILHGCSIGDNCIIGMGATILDNAIVGEGSIVGAHTLIPKGKIYPARSLIMGTPGKVVREITDIEFEEILSNALRYQETGKNYRLYFENSTKSQ